MRRRATRLVQLLTLHLSWMWHARPGRVVDLDWVVGPYEIARVLRDLAAAVPSSYAIALARHPMFPDGYDWLPPERSGIGPIRVLRAWMRGPWQLGRLAARARGFVYLGPEGFLLAETDDREYEFRFLKRRGKAIVCFLTGTDIRSPRLMRELESSMGEPNLGTWQAEVVPGWTSEAYDDRRRRFGEVISRYADAAFNADRDQRGYLSMPAEPYEFFFPDAWVLDDFTKFAEPRMRVLHFPSAPVIKGTQLVRAAVERLRADGYDFDYIELQGVPNATVREELAKAHIVLQEFYAFMPGVAAVEAMASCTAVMTRASHEVEPQLPSDSQLAWFVTRHFEVTEHLRTLLDDRGLAERFARAGRQWVLEHAVASVTGPRVRAVLDRVLAELSGGDGPRAARPD